MTTQLDEVREISKESEMEISPPELEVEVRDTKTETFKVSGEYLWHQLKDLMHQGNVRRILIKNEAGHLLLEIPVTVGVVGGVAGLALFPEIVAIGVIGSMFAHLTLTVERTEDAPQDQPD